MGKIAAADGNQWRGEIPGAYGDCGGSQRKTQGQDCLGQATRAPRKEIRSRWSAFPTFDGDVDRIERKRGGGGESGRARGVQIPRYDGG